jgi:hypothetical protein
MADDKPGFYMVGLPPEPEPKPEQKPAAQVKPRPTMRVPWTVTDPEPESEPEQEPKPFASVYINDVVWRGGMGTTWDGAVQ